MEKPKLTQFSHGSGCGCKIAPTDLENILKGVSGSKLQFQNLLVGNGRNDDAAVMEIDSGHCVISTTDFFTPIVDDAAAFGKIAAANAISDVYAMGGSPIMAIGILGWPIEQLGAKLAAEVISGAQLICDQARIPLAGGHSIDSREPFFGLSVTGLVNKEELKTNDKAQAGDTLYITKPIGSGILSTAMKRGLSQPDEDELLMSELVKLNTIGKDLSKISGVNALTDVTGFGLMGHLIEVCQASKVQAELDFDSVPTYPMEILKNYLDRFIMPDNTMRNFKMYSKDTSKLSATQLQLLCDPQTNGGLLISASDAAKSEVENTLSQAGCEIWAIGKILSNGTNDTLITIN